ncbi:MAG: permease prefix domain 1-containing protein [Leeuwenhoekiella sp.]
MENTTKFDLTQNVVNWKADLHSKENLTQENILELESHLLDEIESLKTKTLSEEEAFFVAIKRLGNSESLSQEYGKVNSNIINWEKLLTQLQGVLIYFCFFGVVRLLMHVYNFFTYDASTSSPSIEISNLVIQLTLGLIFIVLYSFQLKVDTSKFFNLRNIPLLIVFAIVTQSFSLWAIPAMMSSKYYAIDMINFHAFKIIFSIVVMCLAGFTFYKFMKKNKQTLQISS